MANAPLAPQARAQQIRDDVLVGIPNYPGDAAHLSYLRRGTLRVTACDQNPALRVGAVDAADQLPDFSIRSAGDGASVQNRYLARGNILGLVEARLEQLLFDRSAVRLARAATEIENLECEHSRNIIVADFMICQRRLFPGRSRAQVTVTRKRVLL